MHCAIRSKYLQSYEVHTAGLLYAYTYLDRTSTLEADFQARHPSPPQPRLANFFPTAVGVASALSMPSSANESRLGASLAATKH